MAAPAPHNRTDSLTAGPPRVCIVVSRYNDAVTGSMRAAAEAAYASRFAGRDDLYLGIVEAPGAYELTALSAAAIESGAYEGVVALGCVIRGETDHDRYISQAVASGLTTLSLQSGVPVAFGVITANTREQAIARAGGTDGQQPGTGQQLGNKGTEAMDALLDTIDAARHLYDTAADGVPANFSLSRTPTDKTGAPASAGSS